MPRAGRRRRHRSSPRRRPASASAGELTRALDGADAVAVALAGRTARRRSRRDLFDADRRIFQSFGTGLLTQLSGLGSRSRDDQSADPASSPARASTASSMSSVSRPVKVFC